MALLSSIRHGVGAVVEAALVAAIAIALVFGVGVAGTGFPVGVDQALAAKGGKPYAAANGSYIELNAGGDVRLGGKVTFSSRASGLGGGEYPMILVACWSDATGDKVYAQLDHPDTVFVLGGGSSPWWEVGGSADCRAWLYSYGGKTKGGYDDIYVLAGPVTFHAAG